MEGMPSFIKIGGAVSEKNNYTRQTFVVLYIGSLSVIQHWLDNIFRVQKGIILQILKEKHERKL